MIYTTLSDRVFSVLRNQILTGVYKPDDRLLYASIAEEMDVSLTPVKEALLRLEQEGLVRIIPRKGAFVSQISEQDALEYTRIRHSLESLAARTICEEGGLSEADAKTLRLINRRLALMVSERDQKKGLEYDNDFHLSIIRFSGNRRLEKMMRQMPLANITASIGSQTYILENGTIVVNTHTAIINALVARDAVAAESLLYTNFVLPVHSVLATKKEAVQARTSSLG